MGGNDGRKDGQGAGRRDVAGGRGLQGLRDCGAGRSRGGRGEARRREQRRVHQSGFRQLLKLDLQKDRRCIGDAHGTCYSGILALAGDRIVRGRVQEKVSHADPDHDRLGHRHRAGAGKKRDLLVKKVFDAKKREAEEGERRHGNVFSNYAHGLPALLPLLFARHSSQAKNAAKSARLK